MSSYEDRLEAAVQEVVDLAYTIGAKPGSTDFKRMCRSFSRAYDVNLEDVSVRAEDALYG